MAVPVRSVVLVEADAAVRAGMVFALGSLGIDVAEAGDAAEGMRRILAGAADVAIVDLQLTDGSGYDFALWLRRHRPHMPLVMISTDFRDVGPVQPPRVPRRRITLLAKPFSVGELVAAISTASEAGGAHGG